MPVDIKGSSVDVISTFLIYSPYTVYSRTKDWHDIGSHEEDHTEN